MWGSNVLVIYTPSYTYHRYLKAIGKLNQKHNLKRLYKRDIYIQVVLKNDFHIDLLYFDGTIHERYRKISMDRIVKDIDMMSLRKTRSFA